MDRLFGFYVITHFCPLFSSHVNYCKIKRICGSNFITFNFLEFWQLYFHLFSKANKLKQQFEISRLSWLNINLQRQNFVLLEISPNSFAPTNFFAQKPIFTWQSRKMKTNFTVWRLCRCLRWVRRHIPSYRAAICRLCVPKSIGLVRSVRTWIDFHASLAASLYIGHCAASATYSAALARILRSFARLFPPYSLHASAAGFRADAAALAVLSESLNNTNASKICIRRIGYFAPVLRGASNRGGVL